MKPVIQTLKNNCFAACLASLLEIGCDDVPNFVGEDTESKWLDKCSVWLKEKGLALIMIDETLNSYWLRGDVPCIFSVDSPRGEGKRHAIVGMWREDKGVCLHDPWPDVSQHIERIDIVYY